LGDPKYSSSGNRTMSRTGRMPNTTKYILEDTPPVYAIRKRGYRLKQARTSRKDKELLGNISGVGLIHSRGVTGVMPSESERHSKGLAVLRKGKGKHKPTHRGRRKWKQN